MHLSPQVTALVSHTHQLFHAIVTVAITRGWLRFAGITIIALGGPTRVGEALCALRSDLVLPCDLLDDIGRTYLQVRVPKSALRGGAVTQHVTVRGRLLADFLDFAFGSLPVDSALCPSSASTYRARWDHILLSLQVPASANYTPGGLRGGGAIRAYTSDTPIVEIQWRLRIKHQQTFAHYVQEVTCFTSLRRLPLQARALILSVAKFFEPCLNHYGTRPRPIESLTSIL